MLFVSSDEELRLSRKSTFENSVVIILSADDANPFCGLNEMGNCADCSDPSVGLLFAEAELVLQNTVQFGKDKRGNEEIHLSSADAIKDLVGLAARKGKGGNQYVGVKDDPRGRGIIDGPHGRVDPHPPLS